MERVISLKKKKRRRNEMIKVTNEPAMALFPGAPLYFRLVLQVSFGGLIHPLASLRGDTDPGAASLNAWQVGRVGRVRTGGNQNNRQYPWP